jgi:deoxyadenosine/deoxycytidine kinase
MTEQQQQETLEDLVDLICLCVSKIKIKPSPPLRELLIKLLCEFWILEGIISGGKTTAGATMAQVANANGVPTLFFPEDIQEEMVNYFYEQMELVKQGKIPRNDAAFPMQMQTLERRKANYLRAEMLTQKSEQLPCSVPHFCIGDRFYWGDAVFAIINYLLGGISKRQLTVYLAALGSIESMPDGLFFLDVTVPEAFERKNERSNMPSGRKTERTVDPAYLHLLRQAYYLLLVALARLCLIRIMLLRNNKMHGGEYLLLCCVQAPSKEQTRDLWAQAPSIKHPCTQQELDAAFDHMHGLYKSYLPGQARITRENMSASG